MADKTSPKKASAGASTEILSRLDTLEAMVKALGEKLDMQYAEVIKEIKIGQRSGGTAGSRSKGGKSAANGAPGKEKFPPSPMYWLKDRYLTDKEEVVKAYFTDEQMNKMRERVAKDHPDVTGDALLGKEFGDLWNKYVMRQALKNKVTEDYDKAKKEYDAMSEEVKKDNPGAEKKGEKEAD